MEGDDDMPGHVKSSLMGPSLNIPVSSVYFFCPKESQVNWKYCKQGSFFVSPTFHLYHRYEREDWDLGLGKGFTWMNIVIREAGVEVMQEILSLLFKDKLNKFWQNALSRMPFACF